MKRKINYTILDYENIQELKSEGVNNDLINILATIESIYPLTFFEKESLRKKIDALDNFFWIKNRKGSCELVNQRLSEYFDLSALQLEGNPEEFFFPETSLLLLKSFNTFVADTKKTALVRGLNFIFKENFIYFDLINIPIIDAENTVRAFVSFSLRHSVEKMSGAGENYSFPDLITCGIPFPTAILAKNGYIIRANREFQILIGMEPNVPTISSINEVFSHKFIHFFEDFISSTGEEIVIFSSNFLKNRADSHLFLLGKIFDEKDSVVTIVSNITAQLNEKLTDQGKQNHFMIENLIRHNPDAVLICDKENLRFLEVNEIASSLYGYKRDEFLSMDLTDLYSAEDIQLLSDSSNASLGEGTFHGPYKHRKKDGTIFLVEISRISVRFGDREAYFNLVRNITDKLEHEKRDQTFKSVFDRSDDLIFITDSSGFISFANQSVTKMLGFTKKDLMNSSFVALVSDADRSRVLHSIFDGDKEQESSTEVTLKTIDGRLIEVNIIASPIYDFNKEIDSLTLIGKVKEEKIALRSEELKETKSEFALKEDHTGKLDSLFLKDLFHELLTPINMILGFAQEITESITQPTEEQLEAAHIINQNRKVLLNSMNTVMEYSSLTRADLKLLLAETNIADIIDQLSKDIEESKDLADAEFAIGKISVSLKFETDHQKFNYLLLLLYKIVSKISGRKKIYCTIYPTDTEHFLVTFCDLEIQSSKSLIRNLKNIFEANEGNTGKQFGISKILLQSVQILLKLLHGRFRIIDVEKDKNEYGFIFPIAFRKEAKSLSDNLKAVSSDTLKHRVETSKKSDVNYPDDSAVRLQNELKMEALRKNIRRKEALRKRRRIQEDKEEIFDLSDDDENADDTIDFFDLDVHAASESETEIEKIEIVATNATEEKPAPKAPPKQTDEKIDISNLSCLYFEDQVDAQVLFSVQLKELKNLNFAVSFEESIPLLDSRTYDFIVIDVNLQGSYNGLDILRIIRSMPKYEDTPVFAATAYVLPGDQEKFVLAGFNGFLSKPIFRDQMIELLAEIFNESKES